MRRGGRIVTVALALALLGTLLIVPQASVLAAPADDAEMLELINGARAIEGLPMLVVSDELLPAAERQTDLQLAAGTIFHTDDLRAVADDWQALGENVGTGPSMPVLHDAFMASPGHRANVLGDYNQVAISAKQNEAGQFFITIIFMKKPLAVPTAGTTDAGGVVDLIPGAVADVADSVFAPDVEWLAEAGIGIACDANGFLYCPSRAVTRGEMASMMARAMDLPDTTDDFFVDDDGSPHEPAINAMAAAGVTFGCEETGTRYCPDDTLTRAQMASFFARAFGLEPAASDFFTDDAQSVHQANINALAKAGITFGCNPPDNDHFCGARSLTRGHIAAFIRRALS